MVDPYIMPHERRVLTVRQHPVICLWRPAAIMVLALAAACWATAADPAGWLVIWVLWLGSAASMAYAFTAWALTYLVITNMRIIIITGLITRNVNTMPLVKAVDMTVEWPFWGRVFNYGRLVLESSSGSHPLHRVQVIPRPDEAYNTLCSLIFSVPGSAERAGGNDGSGSR